MTRDIAPRRKHRPATTPPTAEDLEGYLVGVERRIDERAAEGVRDPALTESLEQAQTALRAGDLREADRLLRAHDERLDALLPEVEMTDRPRGLVGFKTLGEPGVPLGPEEDPIANRLLLVGRLAGLRASQGHPVDAARRLLAEAESAYRSGDRSAARRAIDRAHGLLEDPGELPGAGRTP